MPRLHHDARELVGKLLYWGAAGAGATANLRWLEANVPAADRGQLVQFATDDEMSQPFEFLPVAAAPFGKWRCRWHLYTVPTQASDSGLIEALMADADGIVFVADVRQGDTTATLEAWQACSKAADGRPCVLQYNGATPADAGRLAATQAALRAAGASAAQAFVADVSRGHHVAQTLHAAMAAAMAAAGPPMSWPAT